MIEVTWDSSAATLEVTVQYRPAGSADSRVVKFQRSGPMSAIVFQDLADDRADVLDGNGLNGMKLALVALPAGPNPDHADLDLRFYNDLHSPRSSPRSPRPGARRPGFPRPRRRPRPRRSGHRTGQGDRGLGDRSAAPGAACRAGRRLLDLHARARLGREPDRSVLQHARLQVPARLLHQRLRAAAPGRPAAAGSGDRLSRQGLRLVPPHADGRDGRARAGLEKHQRGRSRPGADRSVRRRRRRAVATIRTA